MAGIKIDKIEKERRIRVVQEWILSDHTSPDIVSQAAAKWGVSVRQAYRYVADAYKGFRETNEVVVANRLHYHIQRRMKLLRDLEKKNTSHSIKASLNILDSMAKLEGVLIDKHELTGKDGGPIQTQSKVPDLSSLSDDELALLEKIVNKNG